jgi:hypothetical protein
MHEARRLGAEVAAVSRHGVIEFVLAAPFRMVFYSLDDLILLSRPWH